MVKASSRKEGERPGHRVSGLAFLRGMLASQMVLGLVWNLHALLRACDRARGRLRAAH